MEILALFCNWIALRVTKIVKEVKFEGFLGKLEGKRFFLR